MWTTVSALSRIAAGLALGLSLATTTLAETATEALSRTVADIENRLGARVGVSLEDTGSDLTWSNRSEERFLMNSTVKVPVCGAVLVRKDAGTLSLDTELPVEQSDLVSYAPVTETRVGQSMTIAELCHAAIDMSDNTAANLLIGHLGGPKAVTQFFRSLGDASSQLDRLEPGLNDFVPGDPRDTTTPAAMTDTLRVLLLGDALTLSSRNQLADWMSHGGVTGNLLRAEAPAGWEILDKSGSGSHTRNLVAVVTPEGDAPWIVSLFLSDMEADFTTRNAALQELGQAVMAVIRD